MQQRDIKMTNCTSTVSIVVRITRLGRKALYSYSVIMVVKGCVHFIKWEEMVVEAGLKILIPWLDLAWLNTSLVGLREDRRICQAWLTKVECSKLDNYTPSGLKARKITTRFISTHFFSVIWLRPDLTFDKCLSSRFLFFKRKFGAVSQLVENHQKSSQLVENRRNSSKIGANFREALTLCRGSNMSLLA